MIAVIETNKQKKNKKTNTNQLKKNLPLYLVKLKLGMPRLH